MIPKNARPLTAYSYLRFSTPEQAKGDSKRRQTELAPKICEAQGWELDTRFTFHDEGVSSFRGGNLQYGMLGRFLELVDSGTIKTPCVLIVEKLDRMTRMDTDEALQLVRGILKRGVKICQAEPFDLLDQSDLKDLGRLLMLVLRLFVGWEESEKKSDRLGKAWANKKRTNQDGTAAKKVTKLCPGWLTLNETRTGFEKDPVKVRTIKAIFQAVIDGEGLVSMARRLTTEGVPTIGKTDTWHKSYLIKILTERAVLGEYQPHKLNPAYRKRITKGVPRRLPDGPVIPDYFPQIITEAVWVKANQALKSRRTLRGRKGVFVSNLFQGLVRFPDGNATFVDKGKKSSGPALVSVTAQRSGKNYVAFPYRPFENALLQWTKELRPADICSPKSSPVALQNAVDERAAELDKLDRQLERIETQLTENEDLEVLTRAAKRLTENRARVAAELETARQNLHKLTDSEAHGETVKLIELLRGKTGEELTAIRTKLRARFRQLVAGIGLHVQREGLTRTATVCVHFHSGQVRMIRIVVKRGRDGCSWSHVHTVSTEVEKQLVSMNMGLGWETDPATPKITKKRIG